MRQCIALLGPLHAVVMHSFRSKCTHSESEVELLILSWSESSKQTDRPTDPRPCLQSLELPNERELAQLRIVRDVERASECSGAERALINVASPTEPSYEEWNERASEHTLIDD